MKSPLRNLCADLAAKLQGFRAAPVFPTCQKKKKHNKPAVELVYFVLTARSLNKKSAQWSEK